MRNFKTEGIIIKRRNYGEADRMLTVFTKNYGKMQVKATGVRKIISRRSPHVELLNHVQLTLYKGQGMPILTEAQTLKDFSPIKEDLTKVGYAYHVCELIDGLCAEDQEHQLVFELLYKTLKRLETQEQSLHSYVQDQDFYQTTGIDAGFVADVSSSTLSKNPTQHLAALMHEFEIELLSQLGFYKVQQVSPTFNSSAFIEQLLEKKLKSKQIISMLS